MFLTAEKAYLTNEVIIPLGNQRTTQADPRRLQVDEDTFLLPMPQIWHSCNPNARIDWQNHTLIARNDISADTLITYHYGTSEWDYRIGEFICTCRNSNCVGTFRGFRYMITERQIELLSLVSPYILQKWRKLKGSNK